MEAKGAGLPPSKLMEYRSQNKNHLYLKGLQLLGYGDYGNSAICQNFELAL